MSGSTKQQFVRRKETQENLEGDVAEFMHSLSMADRDCETRSIVGAGVKDCRSLRITLPKGTASTRGFELGGDVLIRPVGPGFVVMPVHD